MITHIKTTAVYVEDQEKAVEEFGMRTVPEPTLKEELRDEIPW